MRTRLFPGYVRNQADIRNAELHLRQDTFELVEHRFDPRRMECVRHGQFLRLNSITVQVGENRFPGFTENREVGLRVTHGMEW